MTTYGLKILNRHINIKQTSITSLSVILSHTNLIPIKLRRKGLTFLENKSIEYNLSTMHKNTLQKRKCPDHIHELLHPLENHSKIFTLD